MLNLFLFFLTNEAYVVLTLFKPMEFSIKLHAIKSGWSIVHIEGDRLYFPKKKKKLFTSLKINFVLPNSADPGEMMHNAALNLGLHFLS